MNRLVKLFCLVVTLSMTLLVISCKEQKTLDCLVSDQIIFLNYFLVNNKTYYLYERRSGFSDKISYLEFYDLKPDFDQCGEPSKPQLSQVPVSDLGNDPVRVVIRDLLIDVEYGGEPYSSPDLSLLPIEVRQ